MLIRRCGDITQFSCACYDVNCLATVSLVATAGLFSFHSLGLFLHTNTSSSGSNFSRKVGGCKSNTIIKSGPGHGKIFFQTYNLNQSKPIRLFRV